MPCYNFGVRKVLRMSDKVKAQSVTVEEKKKEVIKKQGAHDYVYCPECGAKVIHESGCVTCPSCGWGMCG